MHRNVTPMTLVHPAADEDPRWPLLRARDVRADGTFWYSVVTTGVYCRPSCASRPARAENVSFHDTIEAARATGFRPCRRCDPEGTIAAGRAAAIAQACRTIDLAEEAPDLRTLAAAANLSPGYFQRLFKASVGLSPRAYAMARRAERLRMALPKAASVTAAAYAAGFGSMGRVYAAADAMLGMAPARYRRGGVAETLRFAVAACSLGHVATASGERGVVAILLGDDADALVQDLRDRFPSARFVDGDADYAATVSKVVALVESPASGLDLPLDIRGTVFQQRVWAALRAIPAGETRPYAAIADAIGAPAATRAVAGACAANPLAIAVPCHRVLRADGALSGCRWGVARKAELLARERAG